MAGVDRLPKNPVTAAVSLYSKPFPTPCELKPAKPPLPVTPEGTVEQTFATEIMGATWRLRRCRLVERSLLLNEDLDFHPMMDERTEKRQKSVDRARPTYLRRSIAEPGKLQSGRTIQEQLADQKPTPERCFATGFRVVDGNRDGSQRDAEFAEAANVTTDQPLLLLFGDRLAVPFFMRECHANEISQQLQEVVGYGDDGYAAACSQLALAGDPPELLTGDDLSSFGTSPMRFL